MSDFRRSEDEVSDDTSPASSGSDDGWGTHDTDTKPIRALDSTSAPSDTASASGQGPTGHELPDIDTARREVELAFSSDSDASNRRRSDLQKRIDGSDAHKADSISEAEAFAREQLDVPRVDFSGFDQRTANDINATLHALRDRYPSVGGLEFLGTIQSRNFALASESPALASERHIDTSAPSDHIVAQTLRHVPGYSGVTMNADWAADYSGTSRTLAQDEAHGDSPPGTGSVEGVIAHEFGHLVENHLRSEGVFDDIAQELSEQRTHGPSSVASEVSQYAIASASEHFAEAFAEYVMADEPRRAARRIGVMVDNSLLS